MLVEWLVEHAERLAQEGLAEGLVYQELQRLCHRARAISRFVSLWCHVQERGAACQLAAAERFWWPLPATPMDPCELMSSILLWETQQERTCPLGRQAA